MMIRPNPTFPQAPLSSTNWDKCHIPLQGLSRLPTGKGETRYDPPLPQESLEFPLSPTASIFTGNFFSKREFTA